MELRFHTARATKDLDFTVRANPFRESRSSGIPDDRSEDHTRC
jgi:hypothetical protein